MAKMFFRVSGKGLKISDSFSEVEFNSMGLSDGDLVKVSITKPRNPKFNRLVHKIGRLVVENVSGFESMDAHSAIKRLQIEGGISCDEIGILVRGYGIVIQRIPKSISFSSMDETEFKSAAKGICRVLSERYWPSCSPDEIEKMAELIVD